MELIVSRTRPPHTPISLPGTALQNDLGLFRDLFFWPPRQVQTWCQSLCCLCFGITPSSPDTSPGATGVHTVLGIELWSDICNVSVNPALFSRLQTLECLGSSLPTMVQVRAVLLSGEGIPRLSGEVGKKLYLGCEVQRLPNKQRGCHLLDAGPLRPACPKFPPAQSCPATFSPCREVVQTHCCLPEPSLCIHTRGVCGH